MPDMLARFWKRSQHAQIASLEREVLEASKSLRKAELSYFADEENKDKCDAWAAAQNLFESTTDRLIEIEDQK